MSYSIGKERKKKLAKWLDDAVDLPGFLEVVDRPAFRGVLELIDHLLSPKVPETFRDELEGLIDALIARDKDAAAEEVGSLLKEIILLWIDTKEAPTGIVPDPPPPPPPGDE